MDPLTEQVYQEMAKTGSDLLPTADLLSLGNDQAKTPESSGQSAAVMDVDLPQQHSTSMEGTLAEVLKEVEENLQAKQPDIANTSQAMGGDAKMGEEEAAVAGDRKVEILQKLLTAKYALMICYANYGDALQHHSRDGIWHHFQEHLKEERANAYEIAKRLVAMGQDVKVGAISVEDIKHGKPKHAFKKLLELELEGVKLFQELYELTKDDAAMNALAQDGAQLDTQHADDMRRYLGEAE